MAMNPETGKFEMLKEFEDVLAEGPPKLLRPDGSEVPSHWKVFHEGEWVKINDTTMVISYMNESCLLLEPITEAEMLVNSKGQKVKP